MAVFRRLRSTWLVRAVRADRQGPSPTVPVARTGTTAAPAPAPAPSTAPAAAPASLDPAATPRCLGPVPNHAYSPLPVVDDVGQVVPGTGIRKFVDPLPGLGTPAEPPSGAYLPVAVPDTISYPGCDYYEIGLQEYAQRLHRDLPPTRLRGYRQLNLGTDADGHNTVAPPQRPWHLGPVLLARRGRPARIKFINQLPTGAAGDLFLPVDPSVPGTGAGPLDGPAPYPQNRAVLHLCGASTGWISAGNPWQWITPAAEITPYPTGVGLTHVPDMTHPGRGATTFYHPNEQSGRLLWFHDNTVGLSRLTGYSGQVALYLLTDEAQEELVADGLLPAEQLPLVFEDKTFVPDDDSLATQDPTWDRDRWGARGSLWHPHVYQPRQHPYRPDGINPTGRWDYGPWSRTATPADPHATATSVPNPRHDPVGDPAEPPEVPGVPHPSAVPAAYGDTVLVNGVAYPYLEVEPGWYRWRILNACTDRWLNLQLYRAGSDGPMWTPEGVLADPDAGEVPMVDAVPAADRPAGWPTDGRSGGVPDPQAAGPELIRIGNECGLLPAPEVIANRPVGFRYDRRDPTVLHVSTHALLLAPGERADVLVDLTSVTPGSTLILYNDCPVPLPCFDPRYDHHTGDPDRSAEGGPPPTRPGYGPNTRTLLQLRVTGSVPADRPAYDLDRLRERLPGAYARSQRPPIVPHPAYDPCFGTVTPAPVRVPVHATTVEFVPAGAAAPVTLPLAVKTVRQVFDPDHGRLTGRLGVTPPPPGAVPPGPARAVTPPPGSAGAMSMLGPADPATELLHVGDPATPVGAPGDGTQLWRVRGIGRQSHPVRFEGLDVQVVARVGDNGTSRPPRPGELGWKQVVRVDPGEDVVLALRPEAPPLPFKIGDSVRLLDPARPAGGPIDGPAAVLNQPVNLGWEYHWASAAGGYRDQGMSRPLVVRVSPRAPSGLNAIPAPGSATALPAIALTWTGNGSLPAATSHLLHRATDPTFTTGLTEITVAATATRYVDATVTPEVTYHYRIRAENAAGCSAWSNSVPAAVRLAAPTGLTAALAPAAPARVALRWSNHSFATGVDVQRATNPTFTSGPGTTAIGVGVNHLDAAVAPDTTYYYRVRTTYLGAASPWSMVARVTIPPTPGTPTTVSVATSLPGPDTATVVLGWAASTPPGQGSGFVVERARDPLFRREVATFTVTGRGFTNTGLARGVTYHYRIRSFNLVGSSPFTGPIPVTTPD
ncbi:hypothetical protein [Micromonospora endophytica]|uniref:Fibronectin type-III domain-containing protein n=1 Tax=Micromonospora endophytica TaxID=515350 RepID=A0A2W2CGI6_9ACTN|nr:hypothetical protein [Micromonospora endophytica]PZF87287.1 hypothetical protein C1I93_26495 [Micromonospora endophytica]